MTPKRRHFANLPRLLLVLFAAMALATSAVAQDVVPPPPMISLAGQAGIPAFLKANSQTVADADGLHVSQMFTTATDMAEHDFVFDVTYAALEKTVGDLYIGIGEDGRDRNRIANSAAIRISGSPTARTASLEISGKTALPIGKLGSATTLRLEKKGDVLTGSIGSIKDGVFKADASKATPSLKTDAPFLAKNTAPLFVEGGTVSTLRILVDDKPLDPGPARTLPAALADDVPMLSLKGNAGIPAFLKASSTALAGGDGLTGGEIRTRDTSLIDHDFTFDLLFHFRNEQRADFSVGIGENDRDGSVRAELHGEGCTATIHISEKPDVDLGRFYKPGPNLLRVEKRGDTLMFAICTDYTGKFQPTIQKIIPNVRADAPFLNKFNSPLFISGDGFYEAFRFVLDGKLVSAASAAPTTQSAVLRDAQPFFSLTGQSGLPGYLKPVGLPTADAEGLRGQVRTVAMDLIDHDFTFDFIFKTSEDEKQIAVIGLGENGRTGNWVENSVYSRLHSAGSGGNAILAVAHQPESELGRYVKAGRHLFRIEKRGDALTMAICVDYAGTFEPTVSKTFPDIRAVAPFLTRLNSGLFIESPMPIEAVRFVLDGKPVSTAGGSSIAAATQTASVPEAPPNPPATRSTARRGAPIAEPAAPAPVATLPTAPNGISILTLLAVAGAVAAFFVLLILIIVQHMRLQSLARQHAAEFAQLQKQNQAGLDEIKQLLRK